MPCSKPCTLSSLLTTTASQMSSDVKLHGHAINNRYRTSTWHAGALYSELRAYHYCFHQRSSKVRLHGHAINNRHRTSTWHAVSSLLYRDQICPGIMVDIASRWQASQCHWAGASTGKCCDCSQSPYGRNCVMIAEPCEFETYVATNCSAMPSQSFWLSQVAQAWVEVHFLLPTHWRRGSFKELTSR